MYAPLQLTRILRVALTTGLLAAFLALPALADGMTLERLLSLRSVTDVAVSPDGSLAAYTLRVPRDLETQDDGPHFSELWLVPTGGGAEPVSYVRGEVNVSSVAFTPCGGWVTYLAKRHGDEQRSLWAVPVSGGESRRVISHDTGIRTYDISPDGKRVAFVARQPLPEDLDKARKKGFDQEVYEEDWRPLQVLVADVTFGDQPPADPAASEDEAGGDAGAESDDGPRALAVDGSVFAVEWAGDGSRLVLTVAPTPLIDDQYMHKKVVVHDLESGESAVAYPNPGKLGAVRVSPDGTRVAVVSAADRGDPREGRLVIVPTAGGEAADVLPDFAGHVSSIAWRDANTVAFTADEGVETWVGTFDVTRRAVTRLYDSRGASAADEPAPVVEGLDVSPDGGVMVVTGSTWKHPSEVYAMGGQGELRRLTDSNPWLGGVPMGRQEVVRYESRDGVEIEGLLIRPLEMAHGDPPPLMLVVHGGPEAHYRNGWLSDYSRPGQVAAAEGWAVFYPNYRGSTGRGVAFSKMGQADAAGAEFDDLVDGVDHLAENGWIDADRVGVTGGSYGGYATAWLGTRYSERFKAGVMFVGISNKLSKALTTEIPVEDKDVHTLADPWTKFEFSLERSPISYVENSRTAMLIAGGTADSRVHPSQSLQFYRALELIGKTPVRYVRYPGEGHGNRDAAAREDYARRLMRWMDHFVIKGETAPPPVQLR